MHQHKRLEQVGVHVEVLEPDLRPQRVQLDVMGRGRGRVDHRAVARKQPEVSAMLAVPRELFHPLKCRMGVPTDFLVSGELVDRRAGRQCVREPVRVLRLVLDRLTGAVNSVEPPSVLGIPEDIAEESEAVQRRLT
jgi:hypothetical protein